MALSKLIQFLGYIIGPIVIVSIFALFIHCVLTAHRSSEQRYLRFDSILSTYPSRQRLLPAVGANSV